MTIFKMTDPPQHCVVGWPKTNIGYPNCDTERGADITLTKPKLYQFCCPPSPVEMSGISGVVQRPPYRDNVATPHGAHSYYNMMWDGHVRRGDPAQRVARREQEECDKIRMRLDQPRKTKSLATRLAEKKAKTEATCTCDLTMEEITNRELTRYATLELSNLGPKNPERYMIDLSDEIDVLEPCYKGKRLQPLRHFPIAPSRQTNLEDRGTQLYADEFFYFDEQAEPILARLIGAVVDQARLEILMEEELKALLDQQQRHLDRMQEARDNLERWKLREEKRRLEKERQEAERRKCETGLDDICLYYAICSFSGTLTKEAIDECIESLMKEGYLMAELKAMMEKHFIPWLNDKIDSEIRTRNMSRDLLNMLITDVVNTREAQFAEAIWRDVYEVNPFQKYEDGTGNPPPTPGGSLFGESDNGEEEKKGEDGDE